MDREICKRVFKVQGSVWDLSWTGVQRSGRSVAMLVGSWRHLPEVSANNYIQLPKTKAARCNMAPKIKPKHRSCVKGSGGQSHMSKQGFWELWELQVEAAQRSCCPCDVTDNRLSVLSKYVLGSVENLWFSLAHLQHVITVSFCGLFACSILLSCIRNACSHGRQGRF